MSEHNEKHGKREASGDGFPPKRWWNSYRAWVASLDRGAKIRYRVYQGLSITALLVIALVLFLQSWIKLPEVPTPPGRPAAGSHGDASQSVGLPEGLEYEGAELPEVTKSGRKPGYYTFLVCGRDVVSGGTDTMILITYDTKAKQINAVSLLRDTMINTSASSKRLNTVFARNMGDRSLPDKKRVDNGMSALRMEVSKLTGIYPDFYVVVQWEAVGELVDAIGGVEFEVPFLMNYKDPYQDLVIYQEPGLRLLNGRDAMEVIRFRKNSDGSHSLGDVGRTQIQRDFLTAVLKKCLTPDILLKLPTLVQIFMDNVDTDLTVGNILAFAQLAVGMDIENNVAFSPMPCYGVSYGAASMVCVQEEELLELLNDGINPYVDKIQSSDLQLMYQKSGGGFGVTNGSLADSSMGYVYTPKPKPKPEPSDPGEIEDPDSSGDSSQTGDTSQSGDTSGDTSQPGDTSQSGSSNESGSAGPGGDVSQPEEPGASQPQQPNGAEPPGNIEDIDPSVIFPDPSPDIGGNGQIAADGLNILPQTAA